MFNKPPKFINASDVINITIPTIIPDVNIREKVEVKPKNKSIVNESKIEPLNIEIQAETKNIRKDISSTKFRYAGDDIPWIF